MRRWITALHKWGKNNVQYWPFFRSDLAVYANRRVEREDLVEWISYSKSKIDFYNEQSLQLATDSRVMKDRALAVSILMDAKVKSLRKLTEREDDEGL